MARAFAHAGLVLLLTLAGCQAVPATLVGFGLDAERGPSDVRFLLTPVVTAAFPAAGAQAPGDGGTTPAGDASGGGSSGDGSSGGSGGGDGGPSAAPAATPPRSGGSGGGGSSRPRSTPTPAPTPTPGPAEVLTNTLDPGPGAIAGLALDVVHAGTPVAGAVVTIVAKADATKRATLTTGPDGGYALAGVALGRYLVTAEKPGHVAGTAPIEVILHPAAPEARTVNLSLAPP
jgi:hypothetical protein